MKSNFEIRGRRRGRNQKTKNPFQDMCRLDKRLFPYPSCRVVLIIIIIIMRCFMYINFQKYSLNEIDGKMKSSRHGRHRENPTKKLCSRNRKWNHLIPSPSSSSVAAAINWYFSMKNIAQICLVSYVSIQGKKSGSLPPRTHRTRKSGTRHRMNEKRYDGYFGCCHRRKNMGRYQFPFFNFKCSVRVYRPPIT